MGKKSSTAGQMMILTGMTGITTADYQNGFSTKGNIASFCDIILYIYIYII